MQLLLNFVLPIDSLLHTYIHTIVTIIYQSILNSYNIEVYLLVNLSILNNHPKPLYQRCTSSILAISTPHFAVASTSASCSPPPSLTAHSTQVVVAELVSSHQSTEYRIRMKANRLTCFTDLSTTTISPTHNSDLLDHKSLVLLTRSKKPHSSSKSHFPRFYPHSRA